MATQQKLLDIDISSISLSQIGQSSPTASIAEQSYGYEEKKRGAIYTKQSVVDFMLDMLGYTTGEILHTTRLLEPSFGSGRFLLSAIERLLLSWEQTGKGNYKLLYGAIRAVELDTDTFLQVKAEVITLLERHGISSTEAQAITDTWLRHDDYLMTHFEDGFDYVIGNPPYVRQELIDPELLKMYRSNYATMIGRADLYVPFIEKSLDSLKPGGKLSFICADAWIKNDYGRALRQKITSDFHLSYYIDMYGTNAFETNVGAYPSITVIENNSPSDSLVTVATAADASYLSEIRVVLESRQETSEVYKTSLPPHSSQPWLLGSNPKTLLVQQLERSFQTLEEVGCKVGIGVATGADKVFINAMELLDVEDDRKLPLATNKDLQGGTLQWTGKGIINPYTDEGPLVDLAKYPRLERYLSAHRQSLEKRHTAKQNTAKRWYKTIDRITPSLTYTPKLLIPDIKGNGAAIAYDPGILYPHHNLYYISSNTWNLRALQALLRSGIAHLFIEAYSVKLGGGYLRFQAQNLRRIRLPEWQSIDKTTQDSMIKAGEEGTTLESALLEKIYELEPGTLSFLKEND